MQTSYLSHMFLTILFPGESAQSEPLNAVVLVLVTVLDGIVEGLMGLRVIMG